MKRKPFQFKKGKVLSVEIGGKMRRARITFVNESIGQIGLDSCDKGELFKTIKNKINWNESGGWVGFGPYAMISKVLRDMGGKKN